MNAKKPFRQCLYVLLLVHTAFSLLASQSTQNTPSSEERPLKKKERNKKQTKTPQSNKVSTKAAFLLPASLLAATALKSTLYSNNTPLKQSSDSPELPPIIAITAPPNKEKTTITNNTDPTNTITTESLHTQKFPLETIQKEEEEREPEPEPEQQQLEAAEPEPEPEPEKKQQLEAVKPEPELEKQQQLEAAKPEPELEKQQQPEEEQQPEPKEEEQQKDDTDHSNKKRTFLKNNNKLSTSPDITLIKLDTIAEDRTLQPQPDDTISIASGQSRIEGQEAILNNPSLSSPKKDSSQHLYPQLNPLVPSAPSESPAFNKSRENSIGPSIPSNPTYTYLQQQPSSPLQYPFLQPKQYESQQSKEKVPSNVNIPPMSWLNNSISEEDTEQPVPEEAQQVSINNIAFQQNVTHVKQPNEKNGQARKGPKKGNGHIAHINEAEAIEKDKEQTQESNKKQKNEVKQIDEEAQKVNGEVDNQVSNPHQLDSNTIPEKDNNSEIEKLFSDKENSPENIKNKRSIKEKLNDIQFKKWFGKIKNKVKFNKNEESQQEDNQQEDNQQEDKDKNEEKIKAPEDGTQV